MQIYDPYTQKTYTQKTSKILRFLYNTIIGRIILKILTIPLFSKIFSYLTKTKISSIFIKKFIEKNHINMNDYPIKKYSSLEELCKDLNISVLFPDSANSDFKASSIWYVQVHSDSSFSSART